jgi:predicted O-methyltransferase YrrM
MTTLNSPKFANLVDKLFTDAEKTDSEIQARLAAASPEEKAAFFSGALQYKSFYSGLKDYHLAVSRETAKLLYIVARSTGAKSIVEFGTSFGLSTLYLAAAVQDNGGGRVIASEFEPSKVEQAKGNFAASGLAGLIDLRAGDALQTLAKGLPDAIDLVLLDGAKNLYPPILALLESRIRSGGVVVADNAEMCPGYLAHVRDSANGYLSIPFGDDVELSQRL